MRLLPVLLTAGVLGACGQSGTGERPVDSTAPPDTIVELPLQRGFYVMSDTSCGEASNATLLLVHRSGINWVRTACEFESIRQAGAKSYRAALACKDIQGGEIQSSTYYFEIPDAMQFSYGTEDSDYRSHFRYCQQSSLPDPWSDNDISEKAVLHEGRGLPRG
jgi:hypothetical protein